MEKEDKKILEQIILYFNTLSICHGIFVLKTNSKMLQQLKILLLALIFRLVLSNYEDYSIDSTTRDDSCTEPNETGTESNCYCYSQPETEFEYSICAPKKCPLDDACCIGGYNTTDSKLYQSGYHTGYLQVSQSCASWEFLLWF